MSRTLKEASLKRNLNRKSNMPNTQTPKESPPLASPRASKIPRPLFSCSVAGCREEVSYHADQLFWYAPDHAWVCENCWDDLPRIGGEDGGEVPERGISLQAHILASSLSAADLLQGVERSDTGSEGCAAMTGHVACRLYDAAENNALMQAFTNAAKADADSAPYTPNDMIYSYVESTPITSLVPELIGELHRLGYAICPHAANAESRHGEH